MTQTMTQVKQYRYILHLADLHIGSGNRSVEYRSVFQKLFDFIKNFARKDELIIVIAGDIFHHKIRYSGDDVADFNYLIDGFNNLHIPVIVVPGNHDANLNIEDAVDSGIDLITPLVRNRFHYIKQSSEFTLGNVIFYHISVYDKATATQLETQFNSNETPTKILLYHGPVDGVTFGSYVEAKTRISKTLLSCFKIAILGDIHQHQFITPTAAYSGSLIQQNLGEDMDKGFILWNLETCRGEFINMQNEYGFLRLDLRGKTREQCKELLVKVPNQLLKVSVIVDEESSSFVDVVKEQCGRIDRVSRIEKNTGVINPVGDLTENMFEYLLGKIPEELIEDTVRIYASKIASYECTKWTVKRISFDYMFKYGKGNVIDFTKFNKSVSGIIAPNRAGKSSVIDILFYALFNDTLRDIEAKSMIRAGARAAQVKVDFAVNGVEYYIQRSFDRDKHSKHGLFKYDAKNSTWINITGDSISSTYKKLRDLIGGKNKLLTTGLFYDPNLDLIKMGRADRMKIFPELFGMIDNEIIIKEMKSKSKIAKDKIDKLVKPRGDPTSEIAEITNKIAQLNEECEKINARITSGELEYANLVGIVSKLRPQDEIHREINHLNTMRKKFEEELSKIKILYDVESAEKIILSDTEKIKLSNLAKVPHSDIKIMQKEIILLESAVNQTSNIDNLHRILAKSKDSIKNYHSKIEATHGEICKINDALSRLDDYTQEDLDRINKEIGGIKLMNTSADQIRMLKARIDKIKSELKLEFNEKCHCCNKNKTILGGDLVGSETEYAKLTAREQNAEEINAKLRIKSTELHNLRDLITKRLSSSNKKKLLELELTNLKQSLSAEDKKFNEIQNKIAEYNQSMLNHKKLAELRTKLLNSELAADAVDKLKKFEKYEQFRLKTEREKINEQLSINTANLASAEAELIKTQKSAVELQKLSKVKLEIDELRSKLNKNNNELGMLSSNLSNLQNELVIFNNYNTQFPPLYKEYTKFKALSDSLSSNDFKLLVIRRNVNKLFDSANEILKSVTDFTLEVGIDSTAVDINIRENNTLLPLGLASGFQKFVSSIAIRLALTSITPSSCDFIIIDEGFGCMDAENLLKSSELFSSIAAQFSFTFIISHIDELQNFIARPIHILTRLDSEIMQNHSFINNTYDVANNHSALNEITEQTAIPILKSSQQCNVDPPSLAPISAQTEFADEIICICGSRIKKKSITAHVKTLKHIKHLQAANQ